MKYLSTFLFTTAILTTTQTYGGGLFCCKESKIREEKGSVASTSLPTAATSNVKADNFPPRSNESVIATKGKGNNISATSAIITQEMTDAAINKFYDLVKENENCSISSAVDVLFSPEIYPYISWRSDKKTDSVINKLINAVKASLNIPESEIQSPPIKKDVRRRRVEYIPKKDSDPKELSNNLYCIMLTFQSIYLPDSLEKHKKTSFLYRHEHPEFSNLNGLVNAITYGGGSTYLDIITQKNYSFTPVLRLKVYLELLQQTNIASYGLEQILRATIYLTQMFMKDSGNHMLKQIQESKQSLIDGVSNNLYPSYYNGRIQDLKELKNKEELNAQAESMYNLRSERFQDFYKRLEATFATNTRVIDSILTSFGSEPLAMFREIFERIANHPLTEQKDKTTAAEFLIQAGGSQGPLVHIHEQLSKNTENSVNDRLISMQKLLELKAIDKAATAALGMATNKMIDIEPRLEAMKIMLDAGTSNDTVIQTYITIADDVQQSEKLKENEKISFLLDIGVKLHSLGAQEIAIPLLLSQINLSMDHIDAEGIKASLFFHSRNIISATEILVTTKNITTDQSNSLIDAAVRNSFTKGFAHEVILHAAETQERLGNLEVCRKYLKVYLKTRIDITQFQDRIDALNVKLDTAKSTH